MTGIVFADTIQKGIILVFVPFKQNRIAANAALLLNSGFSPF